MKAIKGTNAVMRCRGFKYELGKTHKTRKYPILCSQGFHACINPYDVLDYYENDGKNRFFLVDLGGTITDCDSFDTKVAANEITFLKEVSVNDFPSLYEEFIKDKERLAKLYIDGFVRVRKGDEYNFIKKDGNYLCEDWFYWTKSFTEGFARVIKDNKFNFIKKDGGYLSKEWFSVVYDFHNGFAQVNKDGKYNLIDKEGELVSEVFFDDVHNFYKGTARVKKDDKWYKLYPDGHLVLDD